MRLLASIIVILLATTGFAAAAGLKGRTAWRGQLCAGVKVRAYHSVADIVAERPVAVSAVTGVDGIYHLSLPPGSYYLTARDFDGLPPAGKLYCYHNGAPVTVRGEQELTVNFNLIRVPQEGPGETGPQGLKGEILYQGKPLERVYLYVYQDGKDGFKGPGYAIQPVEKGTFRLRLPPGEYYLLARKRVKGGQFGPIETGDYFGYYYGNPVRVEAGRVREVKLEVVTRLTAQDEGGEMPTFRGVRGTVRAAARSPLAGLRVFAYRNAEMTGTPAYISAPSTADGRFELPLPGEGPYYLLARQEFGGRAEAGEYYGKFDAGRAVMLKGDEAIKEIEIRVEKLARP